MCVNLKVNISSASVRSGLLERLVLHFGINSTNAEVCVPRNAIDGAINKLDLKYRYSK